MLLYIYREREQIQATWLIKCTHGNKQYIAKSLDTDLKVKCFPRGDLCNWGDIKVQEITRLLLLLPLLFFFNPCAVECPVRSSPFSSSSLSSSPPPPPPPKRSRGRGTTVMVEKCALVYSMHNYTHCDRLSWWSWFFSVLVSFLFFCPWSGRYTW